MADILLGQIISRINAGWSQHFYAKFDPRSGHLEQTDKDGRFTVTPWTVPEGFLTLRYRQLRNNNKPASVYVARGQYPDFTADHLDVTLMLDFGDVGSSTEIIRGRLDKFVEERIRWLNDNRNYLDQHDHRFPITWTPLVFGSNDGMRAEYHIHGIAKIPLDAFDQSDDVVEEISKLLLGCFNLKEHPNDYDDYLYLNNKGYLNDSWNKPT